MMNFIARIKIWLEEKREFYQEKRLKKKYSNWNYDNWVGDLEFIWGIKSYDCLVNCDANIHTMNDIDIVFDHEELKYILSIETSYIFKDKNAECKYLKGLLKCIEEFMNEHKLSKNYPYDLFFSNPCINFKSDTIEDLYIQFKLFVNGYVSLYE